jgi:ABC-type uncharacterized transport system substrate-binding protein
MATAARLGLPAIYPYGFFPREGGLISYAIVPSDNFRRAAACVDRILKGANPGELPVQVNWSPISRPPGRSASCRRRYSPAPTR